ncbi:hypothetical protein NEAUS04_1230 [Nematocida ausubeli]|nr:hypothetical protein NEAUS05_0164 [Nematocida ausubeli]KAI5162901.1 hypothetical protein NEAUS04_1230 [Nematocida ausubeli]
MRLRENKRVQGKKNKSKSTRKLFVTAAISITALVLLFMWNSGDREVDFNKLEYIVSLPSDDAKPKLFLKEPIRAFNTSATEEDIDYLRNRYVIVQSTYKGKLVASVFINPYHYRSSNSSPSGLVLGFEVYNMYVSPRYQGKQLSINHLYRTLKLVKNIYSVKKGESAYVILHVSPLDRDMSKAYALYRTHGFVHGLFTEHGPYSLRKRSEIFFRPASLDFIIENYPYYTKDYTGTRSTKGPKFLTLFAKVDDVLQAAEINAYSKNEYTKHKEKVEHLRKPLLAQYTYETHT